MKFQVVFIAILLATVGCASRGGGYSRGVFTENPNAARGSMDENVERKSEAMHSFLVGQLSDIDQDVDVARESFEKSSDLLEEPEPILSTRLAELSLRAGDFDRAIIEAERAYSAMPEDSFVALLRAGIYDAAGEKDKAISAYEKIVALDNSLEAVIMLAILYYESNKVEAAQIALQNYTKDSKQASIADFYLGILREADAKYKDASAAYRRYYDANTGSLGAMLSLLKVYLVSEQRSKAKSLLKSYLAENPSNLVVERILGDLENKVPTQDVLVYLNFLPSPEKEFEKARFELALMLIENRRFRDAIRELEIYLAKTPDDATARYYLASVFAGAGRRREALREISEIKPGQPMYVKSRTFAAFILRQEGNLDGAEEAVRDALDAEPENKRILAYLILILRDAKKYSDAEKLLVKAVAEDPSNDRLLFNYAIVLSDLDRKEESLAVMERVVEVNPSHSDALNYIAYALAEQEVDLDRALSLITDALRLRPSDGYYLDTLGWVEYKRKNYKEAERALERAVRITDGDVVIIEHYGDILVGAGKYSSAVEVYTSAIERARDSQNIDSDTEEALSRIERKLRNLKERAKTSTSDATIKARNSQ